MAGGTTRAYLKTIYKWTAIWSHLCKLEKADKIEKQRSREAEMDRHLTVILLVQAVISLCETIKQDQTTHI